METSPESTKDITNPLINDFDDIVMVKSRSNSLDIIYDIDTNDLRDVFEVDTDKEDAFHIEGTISPLADISMHEEEMDKTYETYMRDIFTDIIEQIESISKDKENINQSTKILQELTLALSNELDEEVSSTLSQYVTIPKQCHYYNLLSDYISELTINDELMKRFITSTKGLFSHNLFDPFITLCIYKYINNNIEKTSQSKEERFFFINCLNSLLRGFSRLFWYDIHSYSYLFQGLYDYIKNYVSTYQVEIEEYKENIITIYIQNLILTLCRYCFYYDSIDDIHILATDLHQVIKSLHIAKDFNSILYSCINIQLEHIHCEETIITYLHKMGELNIPIPEDFKYRIQVTLNRLSSPGGPFFPPSSVRNEARHTYDLLFPDNMFVRKYIHYLFRCLHPYYVTESLTLYWWTFTTKIARLWYDTNKSIATFFHEEIKAIYLWWTSIIAICINFIFPRESIESIWKSFVNSITTYYHSFYDSLYTLTLKIPITNKLLHNPSTSILPPTHVQSIITTTPSQQNINLSKELKVIEGELPTTPVDKHLSPLPIPENSSFIIKESQNQGSIDKEQPFHNEIESNEMNLNTSENNQANKNSISPLLDEMFEQNHSSHKKEIISEEHEDTIIVNQQE